MKLLLTILCLLFAANAQACLHDPAQKQQFVKTHPCPGPHKRHACPGFIVDHVQAICVGGLDVPENMAWMSVAQAKLKDRWECKPGWEQKLADCQKNGCFVTAPQRVIAAPVHAPPSYVVGPTTELERMGAVRWRPSIQ
jgi:hypothetical protein